MHRPWDRKMKRLFREAPRDLVEWIVPGSQYNGIVSPELEGEPIYADNLCDLTLNGQQFLLHLEFQRNRDSKMAERLWEYNVRATIQYGYPVWSCVIYLRKESTIAEPYLKKSLPNGREVHRFDFEVIRLWEIPTRELKEKDLPGLLPLLVLTRDGARREVVEEAIAGLTSSGEEPKEDLLTLTYGLASLAFENEDDQEWLIRRFGMLYDILRETRAYQEMTKESREEGLQEGLEKGLEKGRKEGLEEGKLEGLREVLLKVVQTRFPDPKMIRQAKGQAAIIKDPEILQELIIQVGLAQTFEEAQKHLLEWPDNENES